MLVVVVVVVVVAVAVVLGGHACALLALPPQLLLARWGSAMKGMKSELRASLRIFGAPRDMRPQFYEQARRARQHVELHGARRRRVIDTPPHPTALARAPARTWLRPFGGQAAASVHTNEAMAATASQNEPRSCARGR
jgi:hypothetical protein